jgi:lipopolysaccharide/colanic/teichoic acid biosynthesis glycosyltransferase
MIAKRIVDVIGSALGLLLLSPVLVAAAVAVKLTSPGPVLFKQERVGRGFRPFRILKLRTMRAARAGEHLQITVRGDPRVTPVGRVLRKLKLDELPQLINVLRGDMSLVGPRPEVAKYVEMFRNDFEEVLRVRPGITDLASIKYRDEEAILASAADPEQAYVTTIMPDKIALAKEYVRKRSATMDMAIILRTLRSL